MNSTVYFGDGGGPAHNAGDISVLDGELFIGGWTTNSGLIRAVNSTVYFGDVSIYARIAQNAGDIVVSGGELVLGMLAWSVQSDSPINGRT